MDINKPIPELSELMCGDFASQVYNVMKGGNDFCKSTMVVVIDELLHDMLAVVDHEDHFDMLLIVQTAISKLDDVLHDEREAGHAEVNQA